MLQKTDIFNGFGDVNISVYALLGYDPNMGGDPWKVVAQYIEFHTSQADPPLQGYSCFLPLSPPSPPDVSSFSGKCSCSRSCSGECSRSWSLVVVESLFMQVSKLKISLIEFKTFCSAADKASAGEESGVNRSAVSDKSAKLLSFKSFKSSKFFVQRNPGSQIFWSTDPGE